MTYMNSKFMGICKANSCIMKSKTIALGEYIYYDSRTKKVYHAKCYEDQTKNPVKKYNTNPTPITSSVTKGQGASSITHDMVAPLPLSEEAIEKMLEDSKKRIIEVFDCDPENVDLGLLKLVFKAKLQSQEQKFSLSLTKYIQQNKLGNIEAVKKGR